MNEQDKFRATVKAIHRSLMMVLIAVVLFSGFMVFMMIDPDFSSLKSEKLANYEVVEPTPEVDEDLILNGIHVRTGLIEANGLMEVVNNCTNCHSAKLVTQNRMNAERWAATIDWMQETQNLWDLGGNEEIIINYLVTNYPPQKIGRRAPLTNVEWYKLKN